MTAYGNQIQKTSAAQVSNFVFDARDELRSVVIGGSTVGQFVYDHRGLRIEKTGDRGVERSAYDDRSVLYQFDATGQRLAKFDYGGQRLLSLTHAAEGTSFYLFDALGSVANLVNSTGAVQTRYQYDAWGQPRSETGSSWNRFGYTGRERDSETGLIYIESRYYDPDTGRFLNEDRNDGTPDVAPSLHRYLYVFANPTSYVDVTGAAPWESNNADFLGREMSTSAKSQALLGLEQSSSFDMLLSTSATTTAPATAPNMTDRVADATVDQVSAAVAQAGRDRLAPGTANDQLEQESRNGVTQTTESQDNLAPDREDLTTTDRLITDGGSWSGIKIEPRNVPSCETIACRSNVYDAMHRILNEKEGALSSQWFGAAALTTGESGIGAAERHDSFLALTAETKEFLRTTNSALFARNTENFLQLANGQEIPGFRGLRGRDLDYALVRFEQRHVQAALDQQTDETKTAISEDLNPLANCTGVTAASPTCTMAWIVGRIPDRQVDVMRRRFEDGNFDFLSHEDRIRYGQGLVDSFYEEREYDDE